MIARFSARHVMAALIALAVAGVAGPVASQAPAPAAEQRVSPAALLIAKQIIEIKGVKGMFDPIARGVIEKAKNMFLQTNFMWAKDLTEVAAGLHKDYDSRANELVDQTARIYATHFTEAELKDLLAFYQSPLGRKMVVEEPKAIDESMTNAAQWGDALSLEVIDKMRAEMKKRGHDL